MRLQVKLGDGRTGSIDESEFDPKSMQMLEPTQTTTSTTPAAPTTPAAQSAPEQQVRKSAGGFLGNAISSTGKGLWDIGSAAVNTLNPNMEKNTAVNLGKLALGAGELLIPGEQGSEHRARAVGQFYKDRYGGAENIKNTLYNDPFGVALDASALLGGAGTVVSAAGKTGKVATIANAGSKLSAAAKVVDPLQAAGKVVRIPTKAGAAKTGKAVETAGRETAITVNKANSSQITKFEAKTGQDYSKFVQDNNLYGRGKEVTKKADDLIKPLQEEYNSIVRTGEMIPVAPYTKNLRAKAAEMRTGSLDEFDHSVAQKLDDAAEFAESQSKNGMITVNKLTNTKSSQFTRTPKNAMVDPLSDNFNKIKGGIGLQTLEVLYPGSAAVGKKLQALREFKDISTKQGNLGRGAQIVNLLKSAPSTAVLGGIAGGVPGMIAGGAIGMGLGSAKVMGGVSKVTQAASKFLPAAESKVSGALSAAENFGKNTSRLMPSVVPVEELKPDPTNYNQEPDEAANVQHITSNISQDEQNVNTMGQELLPAPPMSSLPEGVTLSDVARAYQQAISEGEKGAAAELKAMYAFEVDHQENQKSQGGLQLSDTAIKITTDLQGAVTDVEGLLETIGQPGGQTGPFIGKYKYLPYATKSKSLQAEMDRVRQTVGKALEGGVLRKEDEEKYKKILPTMDDTETVALNKLKQLKQKITLDLETYTNSQRVYGKGRSQENLPPYQATTP